MLWIHHSRFAAIFTQKLLVSGTVFAVLDYICAVTFWTMKDYRFYDHASFIPSFRKSHYLILFDGGLSDDVQSAADCHHPHTFLSLVFAGWQDILAPCALACTCDCNAYIDTFVTPLLSSLLYFGGLFLGNVGIFSSLYFNPYFYPLPDFGVKTGPKNSYAPRVSLSGIFLRTRDLGT